MKPESFKILIVDEVHPVLLEELSAYEVHYEPEISIERMKEVIGTYHGLIMRSKLHFNRAWFDLAKELKIIGRLGSGMDNIDTEYAAEKEVACLNAPEGNRDAVAEQTIGMMLSLLAHIHRSATELRHGKWDRKANSGVELGSLKVGIIGYGNVGSALAEKLHGFGCELMAYDRYLMHYGDDRVKEVTLQTLQKEADIVSLHVPLNASSREMIDRNFIQAMQKPFYLFNLSRGEVVDTQALVDGLSSGKIKGLGLDVFENEDLRTFNQEERARFDYLVNHPDVVMTPHIGGLTKNSFEKLSKVLSRKMKVKIDFILSLTENRL